MDNESIVTSSLAVQTKEATHLSMTVVTTSQIRYLKHLPHVYI